MGNWLFEKVPNKGHETIAIKVALLSRNLVMSDVDLAFTPALEQARLIQTGEVSPLELVELYLKRIEQFNPQLGSYFTVNRELAIAQAKAHTELLATNREPLPPFFGVPIAIKDLTAVAGMPCSYGVAALREQIPNYEDGIATRLRQAGFILLGKTATSELGSMPFTEPDGFPPARNPWHLDYTPGGSSGGAAAAVAAGLSPVAQGSDGGGSIRIPAACCGVVGLKPSRGRISHVPMGDRFSGLATDGVMSRNVQDAAAMLDLLSGYVKGDPYWLPSPEVSFLEAASKPVKRLKIAFSAVVNPLGKADAVIEDAVLATVKQLEALGHEVEEACPDFSGLLEPFIAVWQSGIAASGVPPVVMGKMNQWLFSRTCNAGEYLRAVTQLQILSRGIVGFFDQYDALVLPAFLHQPIRVGAWADLTPEETLEKVAQWIAPSPPFNITGQPAIALPVGLDAQGLPLSVQLVGRPAGEATILALAAQLEAALNLNLRCPNYS